MRALSVATPGPAALELLDEAVAVLDGSPARLERAHALTDFGAALRRTNHRADARVPLREALELARRCGAGGLTVKTIETHLAAAYDKLGIRSRQQLPAALAERADPTPIAIR